VDFEHGVIGRRSGGGTRRKGDESGCCNRGSGNGEQNPVRECGMCITLLLFLLLILPLLLIILLPPRLLQFLRKVQISAKLLTTQRKSCKCWPTMLQKQWQSSERATRRNRHSETGTFGNQQCVTQGAIHLSERGQMRWNANLEF
jgi:hypothetical protein